MKRSNNQVNANIISNSTKSKGDTPVLERTAPTSLITPVLSKYRKALSTTVRFSPHVIVFLLRIFLYVLALLPGFVVFAWFYFCRSDRQVVCYKNKTSEKSVDYCWRHKLDIYGASTATRYPPQTANCSSSHHRGGKPVVIFVTGGGWIIGYKMWGTLLARALIPLGVLVVIPDYRNFPETNVEGMTEDVEDAIAWVFGRCQEYGGDPKKVVLVGQSAGAHIGMCLLLRKAISSVFEECDGKNDETKYVANMQNSGNASRETSKPARNSWIPRDLSGFITVSGPCDLIRTKHTLSQNGFDKELISTLFSSSSSLNNIPRRINANQDDEDLESWSPIHLVKRLQKSVASRNSAGESTCSDNTQKHHQGSTVSRQEMARELLPPIGVIHGTLDQTVPFQSSVDFAQVLEQSSMVLNDYVLLLLYEGWSHTDPILEKPFAGDHRFHRDVYNLVQKWTKVETKETRKGKLNQAETEEEGGLAGDDPLWREAPEYQRVCPLVLVKIGRCMIPF